MNPHSPVPRLNLAPKLTCPLSPWNPLDYLRLLHWTFFFPQAIYFYLKRFGIKQDFQRKSISEKVLVILKDDVRRNLYTQILVLTAFTPLLVGVIIQIVGMPLDWSIIGMSVIWSMMIVVGYAILDEDPVDLLLVSYIIPFGIVFPATYSLLTETVMGATRLFSALGLGLIAAWIVGFGTVIGNMRGVAFGLMRILIVTTILLGLG